MILNASNTVDHTILPVRRRVPVAHPIQRIFRHTIPMKAISPAESIFVHMSIFKTRLKVFTSVTVYPPLNYFTTVIIFVRTMRYIVFCLHFQHFLPCCPVEHEHVSPYCTMDKFSHENMFLPDTITMPIVFIRGVQFPFHIYCFTE